MTHTIHRQNKIITHCVPSTTADRRFDWCAYHIGDDESNHMGYGATEAEAIADLERLDNEWSEAMDRGEP